MNILVIEDFASSKWGGAERSLRLYSRHLKSKGYKIYLAYNREGDFSLNVDGFYKEVFQVNTQLLRVQGVRSWLRNIWLLRDICRKHKIDAIVTNLFYSTLMLRALAYLCPLKINLFLRWVCSTDRVGLETRLGIKKVHRAVAVSNHTLAYWLANGLSARRALCIHNGVPSESISKFAPRKYGQNTLSLLYVGRIAPEKGLHLVLQALAKQKRKGTDVSLEVAGDFSTQEGPYQSYHVEIEELIKSLDIDENVRFVGFVDDVESLYKNNDVVIVPSIVAEASSRVLISSIAAGALVIVSRIGGNVEIIPPDRFPELHFDPNNSDDLATKIESLIRTSSQGKNEIRKRLLEESKKFTLESVHQKIDEHFRL